PPGAVGPGRARGARRGTWSVAPSSPSLSLPSGTTTHPCTRRRRGGPAAADRLPACLPQFAGPSPPGKQAGPSGAGGLQGGPECLRKANPDYKAAGLCRELTKWWPALWTFARVEGVEPTNNDAERAVRQARGGSGEVPRANIGLNRSRGVIRR